MVASLGHPVTGRTLTALVALGLATCGRSSLDDPSPTLVRYEIVEGVASCAGCPLTGAHVVPEADNALVLRLGTKYTARSFVRTAGRPDRCIWRVFYVSWWLPSREFWCIPEQAEMTLDQYIDTNAQSVGVVRDHRILVTLQEYEIDSRTMLSMQRLYEFPVQFVP